MTDLKNEIKNYLIGLQFTEQPTSKGLCFFYRYCAGDWCGQDWAEVCFPKFWDNSNRISISTGYSGACTGDEGYDKAKYEGDVSDLDELKKIMKLTKVFEQMNKGKNQYVFSKTVADFKG